MTLYALTGITGNVGRQAAASLIEKGHRIRAVVRTEENARHWQARGADAVIARLDDADALTAAFTGVDGAYVMTPTWFDAEDMFAENERAVAALGSALRMGKPPKIVLLSSIGAQHARGTGAIRKLNHMEHAFADIPGVTALRAAWFMENFAGLIGQVASTGLLPSMLAPLEQPVPMVATRDVGFMVAELLTHPGVQPRFVELEGPRRYAPMDVAAAFATVLGRDVDASILPASAWAAAFLSWGLTPKSVEAMSEMISGFNSRHAAFEGVAAHGETTLEAVLATLAAH
jgi:uncharacterized protein YbjT (DUF2867 family)